MMIKFNNLSNETPFILLKERYEEALNAGQKNIEAISIASFNKEKNEVESRFVNLKFLEKDKFIFFSNYNSPKSNDFKSHNQISALFYRAEINVQIKIKAEIKKSSYQYNQNYFKTKEDKKNALAISSEQSELITSYEDVVKNYNKAYHEMDLTICPDYWGGFIFTPYYFEFWEGHESRLNKREVFCKTDGIWKHSFLQP